MKTEALLRSKLSEHEYRLLITRLRGALKAIDTVRHLAPGLLARLPAPQRTVSRRRQAVDVPSDEMSAEVVAALQAIIQDLRDPTPVPRPRQQPHLRLVKTTKR